MKKHYFKLGLFVLSGMGMLLGAVLSLGLGRLLEHQIPAETVMDESVNGLTVGSPVRYRGVNIGRVSSITFADSNDGGGKIDKQGIARYVRIGMSLDVDAFHGWSPDKIRKTLAHMTSQGLRAELAQPLLGGGPYVSLDFSPNVGPAPASSDDSATLYIPSQAGTMTQVMRAAGNIAEDLRKANIPAVVQHVDTLVSSAAKTAEQVNQLVSENRPGISRTVSDLPAIAAHLKATTARMDEILHDQRLDHTIGNIADDSATAGQTLTEVRGTAGEVHRLIASEQEDIQMIIAELRRTADNLAAVSGDVRDDPARLLFGAPPARKSPGE